MTADDIRAQRFRAQLLFGLNTEEVSAFLEDVAEAYETVAKSNWSLMARVKALETELQNLTVKKAPEPQPAELRQTGSQTELLRAAALQEVEALLHDARAQAQELVDGAKAREQEVLADFESSTADRRREADNLVAEATARAESLLASAKEEEVALRSELERLRNVRLQLIDDVRSTLEDYHRWLETVDPRGRALGRRDVLGTANGDAERSGSSDEVRAG
jgi:DivIVA domain-containing protein